MLFYLALGGDMKETHDKQTIDLFGIGVDLNAIDPETYRMLSDETAPGWSEQLRSMFDTIESVVDKHAMIRCRPSSCSSSAAHSAAPLLCAER